jgi:hypothetical protein
MTLLVYTTPLLAVALAQVGGFPTGLSVYGPIGLVCMLLVYREEKTRAEMKAERDAVREDNAKLREEIRQVAHQMKGLNRNLLYITATHGPAGLRTVAEQELERINQQENK